MFRSYLKSALRNLWMHRGFSFLNIAGLSIGLASGFMILLYSIHELRYDAFNEKLDRIFLATTEDLNSHSTTVRTPFVLGPALKQECPDVQEYARFMRARCPVIYKDKRFDAERCLSSDPALFRILTLPLLSGNLDELETEKDFVVLSQQAAHKIFGQASPINETITVDWLGQLYPLKVVAVMRDIPQNSTLSAEIIIPMYIAERWLPRLMGGQSAGLMQSWKTPAFPTYVLMSHPQSPEELENTMASISKRHVEAGIGLQFHLFPLKDLYYNSSSLTENVFPRGTKSTFNTYTTIAILLLIVASLNFIILSTGRASVRAKEVALRKIVGASRLELMKQILIESVTVSVIALPFALLLVELLLPTMSQQLGRRPGELSSYSLEYVPLFSGLTLLVGILSGGYIAFYLSGYRPLDILRNKIGTGAPKAVLRKFMIGIQMVVFVGLITVSIAIFRQIRYFHDKDMGFDAHDVVVLSTHRVRVGSTSDPARFNLSKLEAFKSELRTDPRVVGVSGAEIFPGTDGGPSGLFQDKTDPSRKVRYQRYSVDRDFIETMKMQMVSGKSFAEVSEAESRNAVIINEAGIKAFGFTDLSKAAIDGQRVLGVVKDFNARSLREPIAPAVISCDTSEKNEIAIRVRHDAGLSGTLSSILAKSAKFNEGRPMEFEFFDDRLDDMYVNEYRFAGMVGYFTLLAIVISCLGLFGVSLFVVQTRVKEIGIRKVMGASVPAIFYLVVREFLMLILLATAIAVPIAIYFINGWLQDFAYKQTVDSVVVLTTFFAGVLIVLAAIGYQAMRAAFQNPVEALRYE